MAIRTEAKKPNFLKEVSLFDGLQHKVLNSIFRLGMVQNFRKGDTIIREGMPGGELYILINGKVEVVKSVRGGKGKRLATLGRGSIFGEMSVFDGAPYSASILASQDCDVHIMRADARERYNLEALWGDAPRVKPRKPRAPKKHPRCWEIFWLSRYNRIQAI